jgi:hypothetical protein
MDGVSSHISGCLLKRGHDAGFVCIPRVVVEQLTIVCIVAVELSIVQLLLLLLNEIEVVIDRSSIPSLIIGLDKVRVQVG